MNALFHALRGRRADPLAQRYDLGSRILGPVESQIGGVAGPAKGHVRGVLRTAEGEVGGVLRTAPGHLGGVLRASPRDVSGLGGLGLVRFREGHS